MVDKWIATFLFGLLLISCMGSPTATPKPPTPTRSVSVPMATATSKPSIPTTTPMPGSIVSARLNDPFTLKLGQTANLSDAKDTKISLTTFVGDSRCPTGVNCMQIGGVRMMVNVETGGKLARFDISTAPNDRRDVGAFGGYLVRIIEVAPYPDKLNVKIPLQDYRVTLRVTQGSLNTLTPIIGEPFVLKIGQTASIAGTDAMLKFESVTQDSRCPLYALCSTSGKATIAVTLQHDALSEFLTLDSEVDLAVKRNALASYAVYFNALTPYPQNQFASKEIAAGEYEAMFVVWK
ncbi:MAG: hypothetical protein HZB51_34795 [Chloroflexi bacterium]|nr:hypothetical protein [Chloroflexota bacterium]